MFIKQVVIQGFKSYRDQTIVDPFDPGHNVVVGRNGSGKSNFFQAIRFVLSDAYTSLGREERQALLHEGAGPAAMSAFVEIIFDNTDNRFPTGKTDVVLRRTIGLQKDEYSLDRKAITKSEVMNLLESAGFSRSNPYYIVPQGRVTALTHAKDQERLQLLKEVAGIRVYENKHKESVKIMNETEHKRKKIDELIKYIQDRISELDSEKKELARFQELDNEHRCLEYALYHQEQKNIIDELIAMDERRDKTLKADLNLQNEFYQKEETLNQYDQNIRELQQSQGILRDENKQLEEELKELYKNKAHIELSIRDIQKNENSGNLALEKLKEELDLTRKEIERSNQRLSELTPNLENTTNMSKEIEERLEDKQQNYQVIYAKKARGSQFRTANDRNIWLNSEINSCEKSLKADKDTYNTLSNDAIELENDIKKTSDEMNDINNSLEEQKEEIQNLSSEISQLKSTLEQQSNERKSKWREEAKIDASLNNTKENLKKMERNFSSTMDQNTAIGLAAIKRIAKELNLKGVYGAVYELAEIPELYHIAAEITAGKSLFHIVVDTEQTATTLIEEMGRKKEGRVTFMPLNRLRPRTYDYSAAVDAVPLIDEIKFQKKFVKAFQHIFGNTIVCETLEVASSYAREHSFDAITLDGDRIDGRGAFIGGYHDTRHSRLKFIDTINSLKDEIEAHTTDSREIKSEVQILDQSITNILSNIQSKEAEKKRLIKSREPMFADLSSKQHYVSYLTETLFKKRTLKDSFSSNIIKIESRIKSLKEELKSPFTASLTIGEVERLETLESEIKGLRSELSAISERRSKLEEEVFSINSKLQSNLERRRIDLTRQIEKYFDSIEGNRNHLLDSKNRQLLEINNSIEELNRNLNKNKNLIEEQDKSIEEYYKGIASKKGEYHNISKKLEEKQKEFEQYISRKSLLVQKRETYAKNIRELGVLPEEAFTKHIDEDSKTIMKKLQAINEKLKKYSHVNKKAAEQYNKFNQQKDYLDNRKKELDDAKTSIDQLIDYLEQCKDEAIGRTFKQVSSNFSKVFEKLVPTGYGKLIMQRSSEISSQNNDQPRGSNYENFVGVSIKVSFISKTDEGSRMNQLSGGQKSLVALALIFAIQECDPAPFYLFDEIDANLDAAHRTSVAAMIHELSSRAQFITTTFRSELLANANKFYGVTFSDRISKISVISKEDATNFVEQEQTQ